MEGGLPMFLLTVDGVDDADVATRLADRGYGVWVHGNWYSFGLYRSIGYEGYAVRIGIAYYNTVNRVDGLLVKLDRVA